MRAAAEAPLFDVKGHMDRLATDGFTVVPGFLDPAGLAAVREGLAPHLGSHLGRNGFEGYATERVYTLVARGVVFEEIAADARLLALLDGLLAPGYLLTASQAIAIMPGEAAQPLHFDDSFYRLPRPRPAISYLMILAVDDFTETNGATEVIAGSHTWDDARVASLYPHGRGAIEGAKPMVMHAGDCIVFSGTLVHRGGANRSERPRVAITFQYCEPWARTQENYYLGVPREMVAAMSPRLQTLLGYDIWPPFMGHVTASHPSKALAPDYTPPAAREPRTTTTLRKDNA
jgi:ectoine hydroxylase-related dioxygenase (phytanoyl-CoA dioxygenase family)